MYLFISTCIQFATGLILRRCFFLVCEIISSDFDKISFVEAIFLFSNLLLDLLYMKKSGKMCVFQVFFFSLSDHRSMSVVA